MTVNNLHIIEDRFKVVCGLGGDLSHYPLTLEDDVQFETDKEKSREFAEVFTPLHIVDQMLDLVPQMKKDTNNLDLCSGYGQFSIRMLRNLYKKHPRSFNVLKYLKENHYFAELQLSSCFKLLWTFSTDINLFIGDALKLDKLPAGAKGIWYYLEDLDQWINVTRLVKILMVKELKVFQDLKGLKSIPKGKLFVYPKEKEEQFVTIFSAMMNTVNKNSKEYKMSIKQIIRTKEGRQHLIQLVSEAASAVEHNWQSHATPEWVVREMVNLVPDVTELKKILVLFNIEFLECLVKEKGIDPSCIDFGYDSEAEGELAKAIYKVGVFSVDHCLDVLKTTTVEASEKRGGYDVIFSNPPYQIQDGGHSASARPIYHEIVMHAIDNLNPQYLCMITPSRWMAGGKGLNDYRARMLADKRIKIIQDFPGNNQVFTSVSIAGGVSYFLWDRKFNGFCKFNDSLRDLNEYDVLIRDSISTQILRKVLLKQKVFMVDTVSSRKPYGLDEDTVSIQNGVPCWFKQSRGRGYVDSTIVKDSRSDLNKWKILSPRTIPGADVAKYGVAPIEAIHATNMFIAKPGECCSESYIVLNSFDSEDQAINFRTYVLTKFFRFMLLLRVISQDVTREKFAWVPDLGDYSHSYSDENLYAHFGLTKKEIEHIEKTIK